MSDFWNELIAKAPISSQDSASHPCIVAPIVNRTVLSITGPDSSKFMQGQFTCNLQEINNTQFRHGACCNAKGRMVANFTLNQFNDGYLMAIDASMADTLKSHLKKYKVFFKTDIQPTQYKMIGIKGDNAATVIRETLGDCPTEDFAQSTFDCGIVTRLPYQAGYELYLKEESVEDVIKQLLKLSSLTDNQYWPLNLINHGLPQLTVESSETQIPQMLNLNQIGGISFSKGCYTGQEIVARMQYLGKLKRNMYLITVNSKASINDELFTADSKSAVGIIINAHQSGSTTTALAVVENKHTESALFLSSNNGNSVELLSLPYNPKQDQQNTDSPVD